MPLFLTLLLFAAILVAGLLLGQEYARPKRITERVSAKATEEDGRPPTSARLADIVRKLGAMVPASPKDANILRRRLVRAGWRAPNAIRLLYGVKAALAVLLTLGALAAVARSPLTSDKRVIAVGFALFVGYFGPNEFLRYASKRRQRNITRGLPNALDLLVVCVESGLGLDQAILQVSKELKHAHPEISEEFGLINLELKAGKGRVEALRNLADRTNSDDLKKLVAVLIQADRFGTSIAQSLRGHADYMRVQARQVAEEKAAKLGVKLIFPIFFCILPTLFVVTVGPMIIRVMRELLPIMKSI